MSETPTTANFDRSVRPHLPALNRRALRLAGNESDAADLVQDCMVRAFRYWHTFTPGTGLVQWLNTVLRNTHYNRCKANSRRRQVYADHKAECEVMGSEYAPSPAAVVDARRVREAVESLPEVFAAAVTRIDLQGMSAADAAAELGLPVNTVRTRALRGRRKLRALLEGAA